MSRVPPLWFALPHAGRRPTSDEIVRAVTAASRAGHLPGGARLPPVRALERRYGLSKNTAQSAYAELALRGVLEAREREGYYVAGPRSGASGAPVTPRPAPSLGLRAAPMVGSTRRSSQGTPLSMVFVDPELLPRARLAQCVRSVLETPGLSASYDGQGLPILRQLVADRLRLRGIECEADHVIITTGSQQALDIVGRSVARRSVALEDPVYSHALGLFRSLELEVTGMPLDPFAGPDLSAWRRALSAARPGFLYSITSFQNPTGYSYTTTELDALLALARELDIALVEDDWGSDMLSGSELRPTLRHMAGPSVLYINSFTKKVLPSLRVGFLVAEPSLVPTLLAHKRLSTLGNAWLTEAVVAEMLDRGWYDSHLESMQRELDARYSRCIEALDALMPADVRWTAPGGGPTLWLELPRRVDLDALRSRCEARHVHLESTTDHFVGAPHLHGFRIGYAYLPSERLVAGLEVVAEELRRMA